MQKEYCGILYSKDNFPVSNSNMYQIDKPPHPFPGALKVLFCTFGRYQSAESKGIAFWSKYHSFSPSGSDFLVHYWSIKYYS